MKIRTYCSSYQAYWLTSWKMLPIDNQSSVGRNSGSRIGGSLIPFPFCWSIPEQDIEPQTTFQLCVMKCQSLANICTVLQTYRDYLCRPRQHSVWYCSVKSTMSAKDEQCSSCVRLSTKPANQSRAFWVFLSSECAECRLLLQYNPSAEAGAASFGPDPRGELQNGTCFTFQQLVFWF